MKFSEFRSNYELEQNFCYSSQKGETKVRDLETNS